MLTFINSMLVYGTFWMLEVRHYIVLNTNKKTGVKVYRTGKAPKAIVGLGYKAMAKGVQV